MGFERKIVMIGSGLGEVEKISGFLGFFNKIAVLYVIIEEIRRFNAEIFTAKMEFDGRFGGGCDVRLGDGRGRTSRRRVGK